MVDENTDFILFGDVRVREMPKKIVGQQSNEGPGGRTRNLHNTAFPMLRGRLARRNQGSPGEGEIQRRASSNDMKKHVQPTTGRPLILLSLQQREALPPKIVASAATGTLWKKAMSLYFDQLSESDQQLTQNSQNSGPLNAQILQRLVTPGQVRKLLLTMTPALNHVRSFAIVHEVSMQAYPTPAALTRAPVKLFLGALTPGLVQFHGLGT